MNLPNVIALNRACFFSGLSPETGITAEQERVYFAKQLAREFNIPEPPANDWAELLWTLADRVRLEKKAIVVFDEINWMGQRDPTFLPKLKEAWDRDFSRINRLLFFLSGSLTGWIERNILHSTGFVGRINLDLVLGPLPIKDCLQFWGMRGERTSLHEKLQLLCVTGGVPRYLEEIDPKQSAEQNLLRLCYDSSGLLYREFNDLFSDLFSGRNTVYRRIVEIVAEGPVDFDGLCKALAVSKSGWISDRLDELVASGFVVRDHTWRLTDGKESRLSRIRLSDNYLRFYLKAIAPHANRIAREAYTTLPHIEPLMGLQFENLVLANRPRIWQLLRLARFNVIQDNPFFQRPTKRQRGCQIDYMIQTDRGILYICEIKFLRTPVDTSVIPQVQQKLDNLKMPRNYSYKTVLICANGVSGPLAEADFFDAIIDMHDLFEIR